MLRMYTGYEWVNHSQGVIRSRKVLDPFWATAGRFHAACLDHDFIGPRPVENGVPMEPYRVTTNNIENAWKWLKLSLRGFNDVYLAENHTGEWMYHRNILDVIVSPGAKYQRLLMDCARAYPGIVRKALSDDIEGCDCHECT